MHRTTWIIIIIGIWSLSACAAAPDALLATDEPTVPTSTSTPIPTNTVSADQIATAQTFRPTLRASFTPTFTPSPTATPTATFTPTDTLTPSPVPEDILCDALEITNTIPNNENRIPLSDLDKSWRIFIPYTSATINVVVTDTETGEYIVDDELFGGEIWTLDFRPSNFPDIGDYTWTLTIDDYGRTGLCEQSNTFSTTADDLITPEAPSEPTPETTALVIVVTATPETTADVIIVTATPENDESQATEAPTIIESTSEPTLPPTETRIPLI
ncbi:MAG: hypothetical protein AAFQ07_03855, partial [Chloroflexota bacterium]